MLTYSYEIKPFFYILVCVTAIYIPLMIFGLLGNILTIVVVWLRPHMRSSTYLYLSSMAVSDMLILLLLPLDLYKVHAYTQSAPLFILAAQGAAPAEMDVNVERDMMDLLWSTVLL